MKVQFKTSMAGKNFSYSPGEIVDLKKAEAIKFCEHGIAMPVKEKQVETQMVEYPKHTGGGWYELSNGNKVQGKENAMKEEKQIESG